MARKRLSAREVKERRATQVMTSFMSNLSLMRTAMRAAENDAKTLRELLAELTEKESPPCSDSSPSNPPAN